MPTSPTRLSRARRLWAFAALAVAVFALGAALGALHEPSEQRVADRYAEAWRTGDYAAMHALLSGPAQARTGVTGFTRAHRRAASLATAHGLRFGRPRRAGDRYELPVAVSTRVFGVVRGVVALRFDGTGSHARVDWSPEMAFPGLRRGERLTRTTELAPRAALLARDGTPLAQGPNRTSELGGAARAAVGSLGAIPAARAASLRAEGVPQGAPVGVSGLERIFDGRLRGRPGGRLRAGPHVLAERAPEPAPDVRTTISPAVQQAAVAALAGRLGGVVALRPRTGEILAFAGIPFSGLQPPGSTFKIVTVAGALEHRLAGPASTFPYATETSISGVTIANAHDESCGGTLALAFAVSCNSVFAPLGARIGARRLVATAEAFGFNRPTDIPGAAIGVIPPADEIGDDLGVGSSAIGQGRVLATTLLMTQVAATIALKGRRAGATLDPERLVAPGRRAIRSTVAAKVRAMMVDVVRIGTGRAAAIAGVQVAGKTGTAELRTTVPCRHDPDDPSACPADAVDDPTDTDAWFVAFAPAKRPRVAVGVLLVQAGAGGDTAAPAARSVLQAALSATAPG